MTSDSSGTVWTAKAAFSRLVAEEGFGRDCRVLTGSIVRGDELAFAVSSPRTLVPVLPGCCVRLEELDGCLSANPALPS